MNEATLLQSLGQVSVSETGQVFREFLRGHVREMICEVVAAEVTQLCGPKHAPSQSDHYRAGSSPGRVLLDGEREEVVRPRVRCKSGDGPSQEVELVTYRTARDRAVQIECVTQFSIRLQLLSSGLVVKCGRSAWMMKQLGA